MANVDRKIRAALEGQLANITDVPSIAYENVSFSPTTGQSYLEVRYVPVTRRPAVRGLNPQQRYDGIFAINCYAPEGNGPAAADTLADNVIEAFEATTKLTSGGLTVFIDYAERQQGLTDSPWFLVPVSVGWYAYN
jgi:hypothetical protein